MRSNVEHIKLTQSCSMGALHDLMLYNIQYKIKDDPEERNNQARKAVRKLNHLPIISSLPTIP